MIFSQTNIEKLIADKQLSVETLLEQFQRSDLISVTRYTDSAGLPWGSWKNVAAALDTFLVKNNWKFEPDNLIFNVNVAYFAPNSFIQVPPEQMLPIFKQCSQTQLNFILVKLEIVDYLFSLFIKDINYLKQIDVAFFITFLHALTQSKKLSSEEERRICQNFLTLHHLPLGSVEHNFLETRIQSLQRPPTPFVQKKPLKIALLICGQLRGFEYALPRFEKKFATLGDIDAYVSTWEDVGYTRFNLQNAYRIFDKHTCDYLIEHKDTYDFSKFDGEIAKYTSEIYSPESIKQLLEKHLHWCKSLMINLKRYKEYPYNKMSNSEKMYYHNSYWIETLGHEHFKKYDLIIKIRPDYFFRDENAISLAGLSNTAILTDTPDYLFQEWGFGLGDQLWIGMFEPMLHLLNCHNRESLSYRYMYAFYNKEPYQGHLNCGLEAWVNGLKIVPSNTALLKSRLASTRLISFVEFNQMNMGK